MLLSNQSKQSVEDAIQWNNGRKLVWEDFMGEPDSNATNAALTSSGIEFKYGYNDGKFEYTIKCLFEKEKSWAKVKTDYILAHEQLHFDISEIHARKLNRDLKDFNFNPATAQKEIGIIYNSIMKAQTAMQQEYDAATDHSRNKEQQAVWVLKIKTELAKLQAFGDYNTGE